jgi:hypothetical protein
MSTSDTYDRYVTWGIFVPEGETVEIPTVYQWSLPVYFPNFDWFFPKDVVPMYAIRSTADADVTDPEGNPVHCAAPGWFTYSYGVFEYVPDAYFGGGIPDTSEGSQYPPEGQRIYDVQPPQWVIDGTEPPGATPPPPSDPGPGDTAPDPGGGGMTPPTDPGGTSSENPADSGEESGSDSSESSPDTPLADTPTEMT